MKLRDVKIVTPARKVFAIFCFVLSVWIGCYWVMSMSSRLRPSWQTSDAELNAQMQCIERRLSMGEAELLITLIPEGTLFCNSLYGFALVSDAVRLEEKDPRRQKAISKVEWLIERAEKLGKRHPFDLN